MAKKKSKVEPLPSHEEDPLIGVTEVARQIGKHHQTVINWAQDGLIEAVRMPGGRWGFRQSVVNKLLEGSCLDKQVAATNGEA
jgi:excisionase family DNA binding protein